MMDCFKLQIPGAASTGDYLNVEAAWNREAFGEVEVADAAAVEQALATAEALYRQRKGWLSLEQRIAILNGGADRISACAEDLAHLAAREGGKPLIDSRVEVARAIDSLRSCAEVLRTEGGRVIPMRVNAASAGRVAWTQHEPIGVVVAVSAFNHPLNLIAHQIGPAIANGCPVIVKPAEDTPLSCFALVNILREAGLPEGWCQPLVVKNLELAEALVTDSRVAFFSFIGSAKVGWMLRSKLAPGTRCALEHGGAAPVLVQADADVDAAIPSLAKGGFYHAGQVCVSVQRVYAEQARAREVAEALSQAAQALRVADPNDEHSEVGPLIRPREVERVSAWVDEVSDSVLCGGQTLSATSYAPTVLYDPDADTRVSQQEIFGPVVCVYPVADMDEAIARANALPYAFQASVFGRNMDRLLHASQQLDASAVMINDHSAFRVDWMPFAGLKQSGLGTGGISYSMEDMRVEKMTVIKSSALM